MDTDGCGPLHDLYIAARDGDLDSCRKTWRRVEARAGEIDHEAAHRLSDALSDGDPETVSTVAGELLFVDSDPTQLESSIASLLGGLLFAFGYLASFVLFLGAHAPESVVRRLRIAYVLVGVDVHHMEATGDVHRTVFRCPYRRLGEERYGLRRICHDVLDRVDDGYVTFLERHRDIQYDRPRPCRESSCCYSEVRKHDDRRG